VTALFLSVGMGPTLKTGCRFSPLALASPGTLSAGASGSGSSVCFLFIAMFAPFPVVDPDSHLEPVAQVRVLDVGHEPTNPAVLRGESVRRSPGVMPLLEPACIPLHVPASPCGAGHESDPLRLRSLGLRRPTR